MATVSPTASPASDAVALRVRIALVVASLAASLYTSQAGLDARVLGETVRYTAVMPPLWFLGVDLIVAVAVVGALWILTSAGVKRLQATSLVPLDSFQSPGAVAAVCLEPLGLAASNLLAWPIFWLPAGGWWGPWLYATVDLHPWTVGVAVALVAWRVARATSEAPFTLRPRGRGVDVGLAVLLALIVTWASPFIRFSAIVTGDEPKYLRYCESWWQGRGVDIEEVQDVSATAGAPAHIGAAVALIGPEVARDLRSLRRDIRLLSNPAHWGDRFNRSVDAGAAFLRGKRGGLFQVHNPGLSFVLLPAYVIDRTWFDHGTGRFPDALPAVNLTCLAIFMGLVVVMRRLARALSEQDVTAVFVAASLALSVPIGAFAFQFYPEMAGALIVAWTCLHLVTGRPLSIGRGLALGLALGFLGWLHVRFMGIAVVALAWLMVMCRRRDVAGLGAVLGAFAVLTSALSFYAYHITGSILPNAVYGPAGVEVQFAWAWVPRGLFAVFFDRDYGLLPLNPVLWLALPGLGVLWTNGARRVVGVVVTLAFALILPTAGHGLTFANTTPLRFVLAVIPVAAVPMGAWLRAARTRPVWMALAVLLAVISVHNGIEHAQQNDKVALTLRDDSVSGWNPSLLFPSVDNDRPLRDLGPDLPLLVLWSVLAAGTVWAGTRLPAPSHARGAGAAPRGERLALTALAGLVLAGWGVIALGGPARAPQFLFQRHRPPSAVLPPQPPPSALTSDAAIVGD